MRSRSILPAILFVCVATVPVFADTLYDNGPINGTTDAWTINFGFVVSNTFTVSGSDPQVTGLSFGAWLFPGDVLQSAEVSITSDEFGGTTFFDGMVSFTQSNCLGNQYGYNVCTETGNFGPVHLADGSYWLNLQNAAVNTGDPIYWDENSGPSLASENSLGTLPSEAFTVLGTSTTCIGCGCANPPPDCGPPSPEPSTALLFVTGAIGMSGFLRKLL